MLYVDIPTLPEFKALAETRADACVSLYLPTTPISQETTANRIELKNLAKAALAQLEAVNFDKRRLALIDSQLADLTEDDEFWRFQAISLAVLVTPDALRTFRLPNRLVAMAEVSDRFHLKPLIRAITFPHEAFVLALSEGKVRLIEAFTDLPAQEVKVRALPKSAAAAVKQSTINDRSPSGRIQGAEGKKVRLAQYARQIDAALRPVLAGRHTPLILAAIEPLSAIFRSINTYPGLMADTIAVSPDRVTPANLAAAARPILDASYAREIAASKALFETRNGQGRATTDISDAARAATFGAIEQLLIDIDEVIPGTVDADGLVTFADGPSAKSYGVIDEIAGRALLSGARVLGVRKDDLPGPGHLAAILRYPV